MVPQMVDAGNTAQRVRPLSGVEGLLSAVPYRFNLSLTQVAIATGTHMVDLGGHTGIVRAQLRFDRAAEEVGVTVVPDCGMGPGMNITLALHAMSLLDEAEEVRIYAGGLPQDPRPPWNYALLFNVEGLINEYDGEAIFLREGKLTPVPALSGLEELGLPPPGRLEAFVTSGGLSTMPWTFQGKMRVLENKTLRYPGHCLMMRGLKEAGLFSREEVQVGGCRVRPRALLSRLLEERLSQPEVRDVCLIHVRARGKKAGEPAEARVQLLDYFDAATGFRPWSGSPAGTRPWCSPWRCGGRPPGVTPIERALPPELVLPQAEARGWAVQHSVQLEDL